VFPSRRVVPYLIAQLAGAIGAAWLLLLAFGGPVINLGATLVDTQRITYAGAFMFEAVGTCFLCSVVLHTAVRSPSSLAPAAIGMTVTLCILGFGIVTGGSINPARTIGPAVIAGLYREVPLWPDPWRRLFSDRRASPQQLHRSLGPVLRPHLHRFRDLRAGRHLGPHPGALPRP
jgi:glycerol uptake facilitator-like aquaporin